MRYLAKLAVSVFLCGGAGSAALITQTPLPGALNSLDTFDVYLGLAPDSGGDILAFSIDLYHTEDLAVDSVIETGFFAANGVFFTYTPGPGSLTAISDAASGPTGLTFEDLVVRIRFTFLGPGEVPTNVWIDPTTSYLLDSSFSEAPFSIGSALPPPPAAVPEPATFGLAGAAMVAACIVGCRRRP